LYAVIGQWETDAVDEQQFAHIVSVVREHPGFVRMLTGKDTDESGIAHSVVVLDSHDNAIAFKTGVLSNIASASLRIVEVLADA
jgi:hypothetical protein